jgi:cob(I)alamin adenosyltransferase
MSSIVTKRGDDGYTDRLFGGRARKDSLLIEAIGSLDELNAAVGVAGESDRIPAREPKHIHDALVSIMGELSAGPSHYDRYVTQFAAVGDGVVLTLVARIEALEADKPSFRDWATPSSQWDLACRISRRAERAVLRLHFEAEPVREPIRIYLNRLSDYLWLLGRPLL